MEDRSVKLFLDVSEASLIYARLICLEDIISSNERDLLRKIEAFLYAQLSIADLEALSLKHRS